MPASIETATLTPETPVTALARSASERAPVRMGLAPTTLEEGWRLAQYFAKSGLVPKDYRDKPENVLVAIQMGMEIGLPPMQAVQGIAVINGRPGVWGAAFLALIVSSPKCTGHEEYYEVNGERRAGLVAADWTREDTAAVCTFTRAGRAAPVTARFTVGQAKKAGLLSKEGPWQTYPDRMLKMRARGFAGNDAFPDLLKGIRSAEELQDLPPVDVVSAPPPREVRRLSETPAAATSPVAAAASTSDVASAAPVASDVVLIGLVKEVSFLMNTAYLYLATGECVAIVADADRVELEKFVGTDHPIRIVATPSADGIRLKSFAIAE